MEMIWLIIAGIVGLAVGAGLMYALYVSKAQQRISGYARELEETGKRAKNLENTLHDRDAELTQWRDRVETTESLADQERVKREGLDQTIERIGGQVHDYEERLRAAESDLATARSGRSQMEREVESLRGRWEEEHRTAEALQIQLRDAEAERSDLEARLNDMENKKRSVLDTVKRTLAGDPDERRVEKHPVEATKK